MTKHEEPLKTLDELEAGLNEVVQQPTPKDIAKMGIELHGQFHRVFEYHEANPDEPFDQERFTALSRRLMVEVFGVGGLLDEGEKQ